MGLKIVTQSSRSRPLAIAPVDPAGEHQAISIQQQQQQQ